MCHTDICLVISLISSSIWKIWCILDVKWFSARVFPAGEIRTDQADGGSGIP
jgi:hypothetical protein